MAAIWGQLDRSILLSVRSSPVETYLFSTYYQLRKRIKKEKELDSYLHPEEGPFLTSCPPSRRIAGQGT